MGSARAFVLLVAMASLGCGAETDPASSGAGGGGGGVGQCQDGAWRRDDGTCAPAGLPPDMPCPPGEWARDDGTCVPAGVPPDGCGKGFVHDGDRGCEPILPLGACDKGRIAVPGDRVCRDVAPCGEGTWGEIPVEPSTQYVDASYAGGDGNGTAQKPWTSIQQGVDAAATGAIVAVAAGVYAEDVVVQSKRVRLWGRCPELVEVVGQGAKLAAVGVRSGADGTELRGLSVTGPKVGVNSSGSLDVVVDQLRIHDALLRGLQVASVSGTTSVTVRRSLIEDNGGYGVLSAADLVLESTVVRGTVASDAVDLGRGLAVQSEAAVPKVLVRGCVFDSNHDYGISVVGGDLTIEASVVRGTLPVADGTHGYGVIAQGDRTSASVRLVGSLVESNHGYGVVGSGGDVTVEASVVRGTLKNADGVARGVAALVQGARPRLAVRRSLVEGHGEVGISVVGAETTVEATAIRDNAERGVGVSDALASGTRASLSLAHSWLASNGSFGLFVQGSDVTVESSVVRDTLTDAAMDRGRGIHIQRRPESQASANAVVHATAIEASFGAGLIAQDSVVTLEACVVRDTKANAGGLAGDGLIAFSSGGGSAMRVLGTRIERSSRAAISTFGAALELEGNLLACQSFDVTANPYGGLAPTITDRGGNLCGCPEPNAGCVPSGAGVEPPAPIGGLE